MILLITLTIAMVAFLFWKLFVSKKVSSSPTSGVIPSGPLPTRTRKSKSVPFGGYMGSHLESNKKPKNYASNSNNDFSNGFILGSIINTDTGGESQPDYHNSNDHSGGGHSGGAGSTDSWSDSVSSSYDSGSSDSGSFSSSD